MPKTKAILLAAGLSSRFGAANKLFAEVGGEVLIARVAKSLLASRANGLIVVTGRDHDLVSAALAKTDATICRNPRPEAGMASSIAVGVSALSADVGGALIVPGDMALLSPALIDRLFAAFEATGCCRIVYPATRTGEQRTPVLWPRTFFTSLRRLEGEKGGKALLHRHADLALAVTVADEQELADIDTREDLLSARHAISAEEVGS
jgi:molybdenum cofactor cytidylyltransferase